MCVPNRTLRVKMSNLIKIIKKKNLINDIFHYDVILFPMGINNSMGKGFVYELGLNFPEIKETENEMGYGDIRKLGNIHENRVDGRIFTACYIHSGGYNKNEDGSYLNIDALKKCLKEINDVYKGKKIASIILGGNTFDGNYSKKKVIDLFKEICKDCDIALYENGESSYILDRFKEIAEVRRRFKDKDISRDEYLKIRSNIEWRRLNGIFKEQPDDYVFTPKKKNKAKFLFRGGVRQY